MPVAASLRGKVAVARKMRVATARARKNADSAHQEAGSKAMGAPKRRSVAAVMAWSRNRAVAMVRVRPPEMLHHSIDRRGCSHEGG